MTRTPHPWLMLTLDVIAQASATVLVSTPAFLIPLLHTQRGVSLVVAGTLAAAPTLGMVLTLIAWGALTDRIGERRVIAAGLALAAVAAVAGACADGYAVLGLCLFLAGMMVAAPNAASGRIVVGWFPRERRGLAMGIRQMSQPLGAAVAAVIVPPLAETAGIGTALMVPAALTRLSAIACAIWIVDPARGKPGTARATTINPYRADATLWRIHLVSALLVVPQFTVSTFGLVWLVAQWHWSAISAGALVGLCQFVGAFGRIGVGTLSDRVGSRLRPLRWVACSAVEAMCALAATGVAGGWSVAPLLIIASIITVADNGLAFTAVAEIAGPDWSGRALGGQNTGQFLAASAVGPLVGALIALVGYPFAFAVVALSPLIAVPIVPTDRRDDARVRP